MVCDIDDFILNQYIGVGNYDKIIEFLYFEPYDERQIAEFRKKYSDYMAIPSREDEDSKSSFYRKMHNDCTKHKLFLTKMHNIFEMLCIFQSSG